MNIHVKITRDENAKYFDVGVGDIIEVDFEEYVAAVVASEIGNSNLEACKAQAVASRTFAYRYIDKVISDSSSSAQAYRAARYNFKNYPNAIAGAELTEGEILYYNNKPITAVFSASNGGQTVSSKERWGTTYAYLISQRDEWDSPNGTDKKTGHGVGMSQRGIKRAASLGVKYTEMLKFYYPHTILMKNYGAEQANIPSEIPKLYLEQLRDKLEDIKNKIQ